MDTFTSEDKCERLTLLADSIQKKLKDHISPIPSSPSRSEFMSLVTALPDLIYGVLSPITKKPISQHRFLWVCTLEEVTLRTSAICKLYNELPYQSRPDTDSSHICNELKSVINNLFSCVNSFLSQADVSSFLNAGSVYENRVRTSFTALLCAACDLVDNAQEIMYDGAFYRALTSLCVRAVVAVSRKQYEQWEQKLMCEADMTKLLVSLTRSSFHLGTPEFVEPLFHSASGKPPVTETYPLDSVAHLETNLPLLMDFYRYSGFCLVTLAVSDDSSYRIRREYAELANYFLVTLLSLPNLSLENYPFAIEATSAFGAAATRHRISERYFSLQDREEVSFFFVLSYILRMEKLSSLADPSPRFRSEIFYFVDAFGKRISSDLDISASRNQSYSNSTISMLSLEQRARDSIRKANANTLSVILVEGTYKEKLHLVKIFFDNLAAAIKYPSRTSIATIVETFNFESVPEGCPVMQSMKNQDFHHLLSNVDIHTYPGKKLYVEAVEKIIRLLQLLTVSHMYTTLGLDSNPDLLMTKLFKTSYTFASVSQIKPILIFENDGKLRSISKVSLDEEREIASQLDMITATHDLEQLMR
ncbi:hypothetical_protein [Candidozyma auris]|uniref:hypothetical_protein n=1 Tax=Candidozyma auris TaxID=498019 RepID=UPI000D2ABD0D|nr:hypothetical_protein [[Candida] auris]QEO22198.1 hypothetical_protein [[Candida] auris]GBL51391.1 hypothetical protein CAJCM15448_36650 [[Candida] auris]